MTATHNTNCTASSAPVLYLALDLGASILEAGLQRRAGPEAQDQDDHRPQHPELGL